MELFPKWEQLQFGDNLELVVKILMVDGDRILCTTVHRPSHPLVIVGELPDPSTISGLMLVLGAKVVEVGQVFRCELGQQSCMVPLSVCTREKIHQVVELCCGMGAFSSICAEVGLTTLGGVDHNGRWQELFTALHGNASFLTGDCADPNVIMKLYHMGASHAMLIAGVSCQPHSLGGDRKGMFDPRASSLPRTLHTSWCLQCPITILECVPGVLHDQNVQALLRSFCEATGSCLTQTVLRLSDSWCARRDRWFAVLSCPVIGPIEIPNMPQQPHFSKVGSVMPFVHSLSVVELQELELTLYELNKFEEFAVGGVANSYLNMEAVLPTCLHSAGNQLYHCKCGCRPPFSLQRLASKGLYGVLVPLPEVVRHCNVIMRKCRYLHPREMFLLNGGCPDVDLPGDLRMALSGVGQCVSPLQAIWVMSHVAQALNRICQSPVVVPEQVFEAYVKKICKARDALWPQMPPVPMPVVQSQGEVCLVDPAVGTRVSVKVQKHATVQQLLLAENNLRSDPSHVLHCLFQGAVGVSQDMVVSGQEFATESVPNRMQNSQDMTCPCEEWDEPMEVAKVAVLSQVEVNQDPVEVPITPTLSFRVMPDSSQNEGVQALRALDFLDFMDLIPPKVVHVTGLCTHVRTLISFTDRLDILEKQQTAWADDEIRYALRNIVHEGPPSLGLVSWDPLFLSSIVRFGHLQSMKEYVDLLPEKAVIISAVIIEKHWYPIVWTKASTELQGATCGHHFNTSIALQSLHATVCKLLGLPVTQLHYFGTNFVVTECCGAMAVDFIASQVSNREVPLTLDELKSHHEAYRVQFAKSLKSECSRPWTWGLGTEDWRSNLANLLKTHGVQEAEIDSRIKMLCDRLGEGKVCAAMQSMVPWKELKWIANAATPAVQIVKPSELQDAVAAKAAKGVPVGNRAQKRQQQGKSQGKGKGSLRRIDPATLKIETGVFVCGHNYQLGQLDLARISHNANGVVVCGLNAALPFLKSGKQLSVGGLALIIVDDLESSVNTQLIAEKVRLPAICTLNNQPLLVDGLMYQLGALPVTRKHHSEKLELISVDSCVTKIMIFKDLTSENWSQVVAHPLKHIFARIPVLQKCPNDDCDQHCEHWHDTETTKVDDPILELWNKQYLKMNFEVSKPEDADLYAVHVRLPHCVQNQVQTYSGIGGVFLEPKGENGRSPSSAYQVIWLPKSTFQDVQVLRQTISGVVGIARLGSRYGLRCLVANASAVHSAVKPGVSFLPPGRKQQFLVGPVPYGTLKNSLCEMFDAIQWKARPISASSAASHIEGLMWRVQSVEDPPVTSIHASHGDMVITKIQDSPPPKVSQGNVVGTSHTVHLCTANSSADPLQTHDPWAVANRLGAQVPTPVIGGDDPVAVLEQKVLSALEAKLPEVCQKPADEVTSRVAVLEQQVKVLSEQQTQLHGVVQEQGFQHQQQIAQVQQQNVQLEGAVKQNTDQLTHFQSKFWAQLEQQQSHLTSLFQDQMGRIEQLINVSKKPRKESPGPSF